MKIKIAICDDDIMTLETIPGAISGNFRYHNIETSIHRFSSPLTLKNKIQDGFDLYFLDIDMPELDGIKLAEIIKREDKDATIIFISGREERVFEAFSVQPFGFVRKLNFIEDISKVIKRYVLSMNNEGNKKIMINIEAKNTIYSIETKNIIYIESFKDIKSIYLVNTEKPLEVRQTMEFFENQLKEYGFYRVHKGYIINFNHVVRIDNDGIKMDNTVIIPVSRRIIQDVRKSYLKYERK